VRYGVVALAAPRIAAEKATDRQPGALQGAVTLQRLDGVGRTTRRIPAHRRHDGAKRVLVSAHEQHEEPSDHSVRLRVARSNSRRTLATRSENLAVAAATRATTITSAPSGNSAARTASRRRRRTRLRSVDFGKRRLPTAYPTRS